MHDTLGGAHLIAPEFADYYRAVHGHDPFPWQQGLVAEVVEAGRWPDLIDVPTGLGKTSVLDVAVFVAAATAHQLGQSRLGRRRCFFVVDRRIVVDEAFAHARRIVEALDRAERDGNGSILGRVASALRSLAPDAGGDVLAVTRMRGGTTWAAAWLDRPDRPGIVLGTVDQVGSRLLFRGYGVTDRRRPVDAALVGTDALLLVDEAHLSTALLETVGAAQQRDRLGLPLPALSVVRLSATGAPTAHAFALDVDRHRADAEAWRRLTAGKRLIARESSAKECVRAICETVLEQLVKVAGTSTGAPAPTAVVVCNTVDRARAVHGYLVKHLSAKGTAVKAECDLLIGRSRPVDRQTLQLRIIERYGVGHPVAERPAVLVATQTVEVGVNLDADVLVSESASWDALVQRLGRLNRLGRFEERFPGVGPAMAVVVHDGQEGGPVYGSSRDATWRAVTQLNDAADHGGFDVSPLACRELTATTFEGPEFVRQPEGVPVLLKPTLDAWVQTAPVPLNDPPIEPFLHGFDGGVAPVQVCWREGLTSDDLLDDPFDDGGAELPASRIDALLTQWPVRAGEIVDVPFIAVRQWMNGLIPDPVSDLDVAADLEGRSRQGGNQFRVVAWRPSDRSGEGARDRETTISWRWIQAHELRPGDRVVVPAERGGLDNFGWAPTDLAPVRDASEMVSFLPGRSRRPAMLRLDASLPARLGLSGEDRVSVAQALADLCGDENDVSGSQRLQEFLSVLAAALPEQPEPSCGWSVEAWHCLRGWVSTSRVRLVELGDDEEWSQPTIWSRIIAGPVSDTAEGASPERDDEEIAASSVGPRSVTLAVHHAAVRKRAGEIARSLRLPAGLCGVIEDAAGWHDLGKVEPRFQVMLHNGDPYEAALALEPLAKSGLDPSDRLAWRRSATNSGLPAGARHEAWSAALVQEYLREHGFSNQDEADLLIHLVASHHGYARPFARLVLDTKPTLVEALMDGEKITVSSERTVCLDQPARFSRLNLRYGRWGLALLESIVRCADMTVSGEGS
ncbi:MAG: type I-U CRISPR-associated helicase/endonuclease Cas3 [Kineosporiaceae bacterium]